MPSDTFPNLVRVKKITRLTDIILILGVFFVFAGWPVPDVNEAHYVLKAIHYWHPQVIANDLFLDSAEAHLAFYWTVGWMGLWLGQETLVWTVRLLTWILLAWSWQRLSWAIVPRPLYAVLSAVLLVGLMAHGHLSGEWVVGGAEAKGFAYVCVFLALEALVRGRWNMAWVAVGAASAFHVLVGGWTGVCLGFAWLMDRDADRPGLLKMLPGLLAGIAISLPGLLPALLLTLGSNPAVVAQANYIYVVLRLGHHLDPRQFPADNWWRFTVVVAAAILVGWLSCRKWRTARDGAALAQDEGLAKAGAIGGGEEAWAAGMAGRRRLAWVIFGSLLIAALGLGLGLLLPIAENGRTALLRYYWFRLADAFAPLGLSLGIVYLIAAGRERYRRLTQVGLLLAVAAGGVVLAQELLVRRADWIPRAERHVAGMIPGDRRARHQDWIDICNSARERTPEGSVFLTPRSSQTFRWRAHRAEVANWKDIPQDADAIIQWWQRVQTVHHFSEGRFATGALGGATGSVASTAQYYVRPVVSLSLWPAAELVRLGKKYGAQYALTPSHPPLPLPVVAANRSFAIYQLWGSRPSEGGSPPGD